MINYRGSCANHGVCTSYARLIVQFDGIVILAPNLVLMDFAHSIQTSPRFLIGTSSNPAKMADKSPPFLLPLAALKRVFSWLDHNSKRRQRWKPT